MGRGGIIAAVDHLLTISGSYRKHLPAILAARRVFLDAGIVVLRPRSERIVSSTDGFVRLEDDNEDARAAALAQRQAIRGSHMVYVVNPGGYVGPSAIAEVGFAAGLGIPVAFSEQPFETAARLEAFVTGTPEMVAGLILARGLRPADRSLMADITRDPALTLARGPREGASFRLEREGERLALRSAEDDEPLAMIDGEGLTITAAEGSRPARMLAALRVNPSLENR